MKITHTSIIEASSARPAIIASIEETYSKKWIDIFSSELKISGGGGVGTYVSVEKINESEIYSTTQFFISTQIVPGMFRVEHCSKTESIITK